MLRVLSAILAAYVGFSFGQAISKWTESKRKYVSVKIRTLPICKHAPVAKTQSLHLKLLPTTKFRLRRKLKNGVMRNHSLARLCGGTVKENSLANRATEHAN
ncbi:hypothetical protein KP509_05G059400 [Ceratopteris richardii]|uniref:Secreted protein n=1 Tax=Ceratopteris richardii TaxID=49495 RepID=A0A8T2UU98_CERRI|nr:hypothetical protein KP509_05G059400 [Ceratopteris richardii]